MINCPNCGSNNTMVLEGDKLYCTDCDTQFKKISEKSVETSAFAVDKYIENLYNTHAFTNEELEDIREKLVRYAEQVYHNYSIAVQNDDLFFKEYGGFKTKEN